MEKIIKDFPKEITFTRIDMEKCINGFRDCHRGIYSFHHDKTTMIIGLQDNYFINLATKISNSSNIILFPEEYKMKLTDTYPYIKEILKEDVQVLTHKYLIFTNWASTVKFTSQFFINSISLINIYIL